jgi:transcriptional regulator with XRE-family HTH domain
MERIGEKLRRRREELGFTIEDISKATRYRPDVIKAVEEGRGGVFPAEAYRQAFLRAYAVKLDLDPAEIVREQKSEEERVQEALRGIRVRPRTSPGLRRALIWLAVIVGVAVALLLVYDRVIRVRGLPGAGEASRGAGGMTEPDNLPGGEVEDAAGAAESTGVEERIDAGGGEEDPGSATDEPGDEDVSVDRSESGTSRLPVTAATGYVSSEPAEEPLETDSETSAEERTAPASRTDAPPASGAIDRLVVSVDGYAVRARLLAGDSLLVDRWLRSGFRDTFYSSRPFWADTIITHGDAMLLVLNGERVDLPSTRDNVITDFRISP